MDVPALVRGALNDLGVPPEDLLLCAVSGGGDSVSLAAAVHAAGYRRMQLAWVNHNLRTAEENLSDWKVVEELSTRLSVPVDQEELLPGRIISEARERHESVEQVAREWRYQALVKIARRMVPVDGVPDSTVHLIVAHHRDDQTETVLSRIADGHPATVPVSIPPQRTLLNDPVRVVVVRPALQLSGEVLRAWGSRAGLRWTQDATNSDPRFRRNALRHQVLPQLATVLPDSSRMVAQYGDSHDRLLHALRALIPSDAAGRFEGQSWRVPRGAFLELPDAAREVILRDAAYVLSASSRLGGGFLRELLRRLANSGGTGAPIEVAGADLRCFASATEIRMIRDIVPVGQRGYLWPMPAGSSVTLGTEGNDLVPIRDVGEPVAGIACVVCTAVAFPAVLREHRRGDTMRWNGRLEPLPEVARLNGIPRDCRDGAAVLEGETGIEAIFWRERRFAIRDGGTWTEHCRNTGPSAVIIRMRG